VKLDYGPTAVEKLKAKLDAERQKRDALVVWHRFFAWTPIRVGSHDCRWLEWIERKGTWYEPNWTNRYEGFMGWSYRPLTIAE